MRFRSILCPVDFSEESRAALRHAAEAARRFSGRLTVLFVNDPLLLAAAKQVYGGEREFLDRTRTELAQFVDASIARGSTPRQTIAFALATGNPAEQILRSAKRLRGDLVVLGTHGSSGVRKLFFGSTTEQVLREASIPVLTVPPRGRRRAAPLDVERVVVPLDLAGEWESDAVRADTIARAFDAELLLVHVLAPITRLPWLRPAGRIERQRIDKARRALDRVRAKLFGNRRSACAVTAGHAADEIARIARRGRSLVVMSLRGTAGVWGARRGSIAYRVLTQSSTPVLALPRRRLAGRFAVRAAKAIGDILTERDRIEIAGIDALLSVASRRRTTSRHE
jgi:nucleotide-binding universal stress UspA family protein